MNEEKRYYSANEINKKDGVPLTMIRKQIKAGLVPGFYSGTWFHIDRPAYLRMLSEQNKPVG